MRRIIRYSLPVSPISLGVLLGAAILGLNVTSFNSAHAIAHAIAQPRNFCSTSLNLGPTTLQDYTSTFTSITQVRSSAVDVAGDEVPVELYYASGNKSDIALLGSYNTEQRAAVVLNPTLQTAGTIANYQSVAVGANRFTLCDFNGDSIPDLITNGHNAGASQISVAAINAQGAIQLPTLYNGPQIGGFSIRETIDLTCFDANNDGDNDIGFTIMDYNGSPLQQYFFAMKENLGLSFAAGWSHSSTYQHGDIFSPYIGTPNVVRSANLGGTVPNAYVDVAIGYGSSAHPVGFTINQGNGTYVLPKVTSATQNIGDTRTMEVADVDNDLYPDLLIGIANSLILKRNNHPSGSFGFTQSTIATYFSAVTAIGVADLDLDGDEDLVVGLEASSSGSNVFFYLNANGTFSLHSSRQVGSGAVSSIALTTLKSKDIDALVVAGGQLYTIENKTCN